MINATFYFTKEIKLKKKLILILLLLVALVGLYFAFRALIPIKGAKLNTPSDIHLDGYKLLWSEIDNAFGYEVEIDGEIRNTGSAELYLKYSDNRKQVRVRALGDGERTLTSDFSEYVTIYFRDDIDRTVPFVYYNVNLLGQSYKEFLYKNIPCEPPTPDYSSLGYEFVCWHRKIDGLDTVVTAAFYSEDSVALTAEITPIKYTVNFVIEDFPAPKDLPTEFTVLTFKGLRSLTAELDGYCISDWYVGKAGGALLSSFENYFANLTLYPRISLISEGLAFTECEGGYAVSGGVGSYETLHIPAVYNGKPVVKVLKNALEHSSVSGEAFSYNRIVFYGDILLEEQAFGVAPGLTECIFYGDVKLREAIFVLGQEGAERTLSIIIHGTPEISLNLYTTLLGMGTNVKIIISVAEEFVEGLSYLSSDAVTVKCKD